MGLRLPLQTVLNVTNTDTGAASINGGIPYQFFIPMDTDNVFVKMTASVSGGVSAVFQTTDDGGTTWYDVQRTSIVSNTGLAGGLQNAEFLNVPVISQGINTRSVPSLIAPGSLVAVIGGGIGKSAASTLGAGQVSGLPIMSTLNRIFFIETGTISANSLVTIQVKVNSQSATA